MMGTGCADYYRRFDHGWPGVGGQGVPDTRRHRGNWWCHAACTRSRRQTTAASMPSRSPWCSSLARCYPDQRPMATSEPGVGRPALCHLPIDDRSQCRGHPHVHHRELLEPELRQHHLRLREDEVDSVPGELSRSWTGRTCSTCSRRLPSRSACAFWIENTTRLLEVPPRGADAGGYDHRERHRLPSTAWKWS